MSRVLAVAGESGSGKTTSLNGLDPKTTFIIDADRKGLSWRGWKKQYNVESKNYYQSSDVKQISKLLADINAKALHVKTVVIDTINTIMVDDEMNRMKDKGYDKWADMAQSVWELISAAHLYRDDLTVVFMAHTQTERDDSGFTWTRIKTSGRKLDKIVLESKFTTVLLAKCKDGKHIFETRANQSTAKSPMGLFAETEIPNDLNTVIKKLEEYEND